jgi:hypothetical protein
MENISIKTVDKKKIRNGGIGDYKRGVDGSLHILVARMKNKDYEFLVAIHELVEAWLADRHGVNYKEIDQYDKEYKGPGEPGETKDAPYKEEHKFANKIEYLVGKELEIDMKDYGLPKP